MIDDNYKEWQDDFWQISAKCEVIDGVITSHGCHVIPAWTMWFPRLERKPWPFPCSQVGNKVFVDAKKVKLALCFVNISLLQ